MNTLHCKRRLPEPLLLYAVGVAAAAKLLKEGQDHTPSCAKGGLSLSLLFPEGGEGRMCCVQASKNGGMGGFSTFFPQMSCLARSLQADGCCRLEYSHWTARHHDTTQEERDPPTPCEPALTIRQCSRQHRSCTQVRLWQKHYNPQLI